MLKHGAVRWYALAALVIVLDQASKLWITANFQLHEVRQVTSYFDLLLTYNPGAAFSFLANAGGWQRHFFTVLALVVSAVLARMLFKEYGKRRLALALSLVLGGALGNVIDRIAYGHVIDFLSFHGAIFKLVLGTPYFPAFNLADSAICVGAGLLVLDSALSPKPAKA
ncbi:signal peptidase II [Chitinimonas sp.]|uniref:signal peptidase II n=1 Tax=Chitinimonas sp. TaxID=1934313 RepID=UPI0035B2B317